MNDKVELEQRKSRKESAWQVRTHSDEPFLLEDTRLFSAPYVKNPEESLPLVMKEARVMIGRASYMVEGPNREILWSVERWDKKLHIWISVVQGRSRLKKNAKPL